MIFFENLKIFLVITVSLLFLVIIVCYFGLQEGLTCNHKVHNEIENYGVNVITNIGGAKYVSSKNGVKQWALKAKYVYVNDTGEKIFFCNPEIEFSLKNDEELYLSAMSALVDNSSKKINTFGEVHIRGLNITVKTNYAEYDSNSFSLISENPTVFFNDNFSVNADNLILNLNSRLFQFSGNVKSNLKNAF